MKNYFKTSTTPSLEMKQGNPRCPLSSGPGQGPCSRVFVLVLHGGCAYPSTEMGAGMTNEDHTAPPQDRPLTVHGLKQPSPESCHPESPLLLSTEDREPWDSALQGSLPRTSPRTPQALGSLPVHHKSMETPEQRSPHERSFIPASRVSMAIVYLYSKSRDTSKQGGRPGGHSPKPAPHQTRPHPFYLHRHHSSLDTSHKARQSPVPLCSLLRG